MTDKLRVWHIPQVPGEPFTVKVSSPAEGIRIMNILADYDAFQYEHNIKPDYCNVNGLEVLEGSEWVTWYDEDDNDISEYIISPSGRLALRDDQ